MNKNAAKYNQKIGNLVIDFVDYYDAHEKLLQEEYWNLDEALEYFSNERRLPPNDTYQMALQLKEQGYTIDPITFHPEYIPEDEKGEEIFVEDKFQKHSIFDKYTDALQRGEYERAHQVFESMTPTQKQVIRDRRGHMEKKIKTAKQEVESVLEKEVPVESVTPDLQKKLPKQKEEEVVVVKASQKILALASDLQKKGMPEIAKKLMKVIAHLPTDFSPKNRITNLLPEEVVPSKIEALDPVSKFKSALENEKFDEARELYTLLSPDERAIADQVSQKHFAVQSLVSFYRIGESLFNKGKIVEANELSNIIKAQFIDLPKDVQQEIILLIVPQGEMEGMGLPQAFNSSQVGLQNKLKDMGQRLSPQQELPGVSIEGPISSPIGGPVGSPVMGVESPCGCGCSAKTISQLIKIADQLDDKGSFQLADNIADALRELGKKPSYKKQPPMKTQEEIRNFLKDLEKKKIPAPQTQLKEISPQEIDKAVKRIDPPRSGRDVGTKVCQQCKTPFLYRKDDKVLETHCINCRKMLEKDIWTEGPSGHKTLATKSTTPVKTACEGDQISGGLSDSKPDDQFDLEQIEKGVKIEMEHTNDKDKAREIAKDHLVENADYYKKLDIMEKSELKDLEKKEARKIRPFIRK